MELSTGNQINELSEQLQHRSNEYMELRRELEGLQANYLQAQE